MKPLFFLLLTLIFCSCKNNEQRLKYSISYLKDEESKICFAYFMNAGGEISITYVPCENVKHLIK